MKKNNQNQDSNFETPKASNHRKSYAEMIKNHNKHEKERERSNVLKTKCTDIKRLEKSQTNTNVKNDDKKLTNKHQETKGKMQKENQNFEIPKNYRVEKLKRNKTKEHQTSNKENRTTNNEKMKRKMSFNNISEGKEEIFLKRRKINESEIKKKYHC